MASYTNPYSSTVIYVFDASHIYTVGPNATITVPDPPSSGGAAGTLSGTTLASNVVTSSLTGVGTLATGTWQAGVIAAAYGGTGVANTGTLTNASNTTITGGGTVALGGFTLTVPASLTVARTDAAQNIAGVQTFTDTTQATSATAGSVVITGGLAVGKTVWGPVDAIYTGTGSVGFCYGGNGYTGFRVGVNITEISQNSGAQYITLNSSGWTSNCAYIGTTGTFSGAVNLSGTTSASSAITGTLTVGNGTAATNVGIGGGNVNAGGTVTAFTGFFGNGTTAASLTTTSGNGYGLAITNTSTQLAAANYGSYFLMTSGLIAFTSTSSTFSGTVALGGAFIGTPEALAPALNAGAAISVSTTSSGFALNGVNALTLANGTNGQIKTLVCTAVTAAGTATLTPTTSNGYSTVAFTAAGQTLTLQYFTIGGWVILSVRGASPA